ncbi:Methyltransferase domain-containing protein [Geodermatophilus dictyosporus]|uniref:Methyltransferase domain-containing protein n=1 Tax=Geodermatophilus dictyosporus TaxID=1523247 RepID=A0A1I5N1I9_9ACTN|nr:methyltransferase domain-containing protein [Geodermatophilus dictyosporus]SFP15613.1 Methyltransferase domain-containing protein [Geodermatophilus dictyosporus]
MSELESEAMEAEFGTVAGWTEEAVRALGAGHAIPAGCRGSGSEGALRWLADRLALTAGSRVLDDGAGVGGPAGWLAADRGVRPVCAEPMHAAARAAHRLFGLPSVAALAQRLPFGDGAFDAAWCLGVLCTTSDKAGALAELRRVLPDGGRLGLLVFVADRPLPPPLPEGNDFPSEAELRRLLAAAGLRLRETATADLRDSPPEWDARADAVDAEVARRHRDDPRWREAQEQAGRVARLLSGGALRPWLGVAEAG